MCECLIDARVCECCGSLVLVQPLEGVPVLMHFLGHEQSEEDGLEESLWQVHDREACLDMRREQWKLLVMGGIAVETV